MFTLSVRSFQTPATPRHLRLATELAFGAHLLRHARHFGSEGVELVHHGVDGVLQLQDLAFDIDGDLLGKVAIRDRRGDLGDVAHLAGQVRGHEIDVFRQVLPRAGNALDLRLATELAFGAHLAGHTGHLRGKASKLPDHGVHDLADAQELAAQGAPVGFEIDGLAEIALRHGADHARHFGGRLNEVADHRIDGVDTFAPASGRGGEPPALLDASLFADDLGDPLEFARKALIQIGNIVESFRDLALDAGEIRRQAGREIAFSKGTQCLEKQLGIKLQSGSFDL